MGNRTAFNGFMYFQFLLVQHSAAFASLTLLWVHAYYGQLLICDENDIPCELLASKSTKCPIQVSMFSFMCP